MKVQDDLRSSTLESPCLQHSDQETISHEAESVCFGVVSPFLDELLTLHNITIQLLHEMRFDPTSRYDQTTLDRHLAFLERLSIS